MKNVLILLAFFFALSPQLVSAAVGPTVDHKFMLRMPDGGSMELKGAKIHKITDFGEDWEGMPGVATRYQHGAYCHYPDANNPNVELSSGYQLQRQVSDGYHCSTQQSCFMSDYEAPYLPPSFNRDSPYYTGDDASFFTFTNQQFTSALPAYLAEMYDPNNIRGFEGARWRGEVNFRAGDSFRIIEEDNFKPFADVDPDNGWGNIVSIPETQSWGAGEILHNPLGENILQGTVTWYLDVPEEPETPEVPEAPPEIPTASFEARCDESRNVYTATISDIDLKGSEFDIADIILNFRYSQEHDAVINFLGDPHHAQWERAGREPQTGDWFVYTIHRFEANDYSGSSLTFEFADATRIITNKTDNLRTFREFIEFLRDQPDLAPSIRLQGNLRNSAGVINESIGQMNVSVREGFCEEEPTQTPTSEPTPPPPTPVAPQCRKVEIIGATNTTVNTNPSSLKPGDQVRLRCTKDENATSYRFQVTERDGSGSNSVVNVQAGTGAQNNISALYTIPSAGTFVAQCTVCGSNGCIDFAPIGAN
ncbi:MAG: hypothetical protein WDZ94_01660 [Patescibacteria group bacterium]